MVVQKWKQKKKPQKNNFFAEMLCIFEHVLTQNPTNQGSQTLLILPDYMKDY